MIAHIFTGPLNYKVDIVEEFASDDLVIGADQGVLFLYENQLRCDLALGDFDSVTPDQKELITNYSTEIITHSNIKDFTDTYLAVQEAKKRGYEQIIIYGGLGKRFDHSYANMQLLRLGDITLKTNHEIMYVLDPGEYPINNSHSFLSLFALEDVSELSLTGFFYELNHISLSTKDPLCVSNQGSGIISFTKGVLLVIHQDE